jgi:hypothetical protein
MASDWLRPTPLSREKLWDARGVDYRFRNPPGYEQYARVFGSSERHGEFPQMEKVSGKMPSNEYKTFDRKRNGEGLVEVELTMKKGRPV